MSETELFALTVGYVFIGTAAVGLLATFVALVGWALNAAIWKMVVTAKNIH